MKTLVGISLQGATQAGTKVASRLRRELLRHCPLLVCCAGPPTLSLAYHLIKTTGHSIMSACGLLASLAVPGSHHLMKTTFRAWTIGVVAHPQHCLHAVAAADGHTRNNPT